MASTVHDLTWEWTLEARRSLEKIAKEANRASKRAVGLQEKIELRKIEKQAQEGTIVVARIFGQSGERDHGTRHRSRR